MKFKTIGRTKMKKTLVIMSLAISGAIYAGTCTYSFG